MIIRFSTVLLLLVSSTGCSFSIDELRMLWAERAIAGRNYVQGIQALKSIIQSNPNLPRALVAARLGSRVAHFEAKDYNAAIDFYRLLVVRSTDAEERKNSQRHLAQIYSENLQDFEQAIVEYEKLLRLSLGRNEASEQRLLLARCHFRANNFDQALGEVDNVIAQASSHDSIYEAKVLKAHILMAAKRLTEGAGLWQELLKEFPERAKKDKLDLNLVACYEEMQDFEKAVAVLTDIKATDADPKFLDMRIRRLKERQANRPGAQGLKR